MVNLGFSHANRKRINKCPTFHPHIIKGIYNCIKFLNFPALCFEPCISPNAFLIPKINIDGHLLLNNLGVAITWQNWSTLDVSVCAFKTAELNNTMLITTTFFILFLIYWCKGISAFRVISDTMASKTDNLFSYLKTPVSQTFYRKRSHT